MPRVAEPPPICQPLTSPVVVPDEEAYVVPLMVHEDKADKTAREAILESFLRPYDIGQAEIARPVLVHLPFWRIHATVSGFHLGLNVATDERGGIKWVLPTGGARHREAVLLVTARRHFAYGPSMFDIPAGTPFQRSFHSFEIMPGAMVPRATSPISAGEIIQPDVPRALAEREAKDRILRAVQPATALYAKYEPEVRSAAFCHYPLYIVRYGYDGHAKREAGESFHVTVSGWSGKIVGAKHPSMARALARKFRRLIS